ncbi:MAG: GFA family protein [Steroidobacter sp.]
MATGSCLCGAVRYEISPPYQWMAHCHCSMCRKHTGALHDTGVGVSASGFRWISGEEAVTRHKSSSGANFSRAFCMHCGSAAPSMADDGSSMVVPAGSLDGDLDFKPQAHIFVGSKSPSCTITDALPQFEKYPPQYDMPSVERLSPELKEGLLQGSCLCGDVAFEVDETPRRMVNCHCSRCRRSRGGAHGTSVFVNMDKLRWVRGAGQVKTFRMPDAFLFAISFCERCGGLMPAAFERIGKYIVPVGALDTPLDLKPSLHIYVGSKAPWFEITDDLPQFEAMPPRERIAELLF